MNTDIINEAITKTDDNINITANNLTIDCITSTNNKFNLDSDGNLIVNSITTTTTGNTVNYDTIYPVGSIYFSTNNINPSTLFGGTWEQIKDCFILASGTKYSLGSTGGNQTHNNMPPYLVVNIWKRIS